MQHTTVSRNIQLLLQNSLNKQKSQALIKPLISNNSNKSQLENIGHSKSNNNILQNNSGQNSGIFTMQQQTQQSYLLNLSDKLVNQPNNGQYNHTFVSPLTRNDRLRQTFIQSNSTKQLPPQHPSTFNNNSGVVSKKLKFVKQKSSQLQKSMSTMIGRKQDVGNEIQEDEMPEIQNLSSSLAKSQNFEFQKRSVQNLNERLKNLTLSEEQKRIQHKNLQHSQMMMTQQNYIQDHKAMVQRKLKVQKQFDKFKNTSDIINLKGEAHVIKTDNLGGHVVGQFSLSSIKPKNQIKLKKNLINLSGQGQQNMRRIDMAQNLQKLNQPNQLNLNNSASVTKLHSIKEKQIQEASISPPRPINLLSTSESNPTLANQLSPIQNSMFELKNMKFDEMSKSDDLSNVSPIWPMTAEKAIERFSRFLTKFEKEELQSFGEVFYVNSSSEANEAFNLETDMNNGYDDDQNYYRYRLNEHIMYRYEIVERLGRGSFGQVFKCYDHKLKEEVALKIIRNKQKFHKQALVELKILDHLRRYDEDDRKHVVKMKEAFLFRNHLCITFEMLNINLYQMIKACRFKGFDIKVVKNMALQLLITLRFLRKHNIVHCDLKPENILLKYYNKSMIKVIDFGSSCYLNERLYTYIQSRFYRSPEVILGLPYDFQIDIWSFGCIICELITGMPIFSGESESDQMRQFIEVLGIPPYDLLKAASRSKVFFENDYSDFKFDGCKVKSFKHKDLKAVLNQDDDDLIDFVSKCFEWDPNSRMTADDALNHPWLEETIKKVRK
ncbi:dual specificity tyrosine-phosphorylation-regulated kinase 4 [Stylonychia lemnae]|uniref:Dual specificity tyrosine-phosphorylation-regulated kinase 4 n=1 Tax=Stylonychia lemnae TaxID=5949 RepID=A0A078ALM0_STYLE|nr:dual specificity tyrosine-phosphorylation-regulated kinase 4 [Stylonychia lemnae]|eukprot:CDW81753.1 dual specificity tyrosine-phosphorylation-regulated kinase 4 [Stylonychia lemnae]